MSKQIGQVNSLWRLRADTAISVSSVMASCGVLWSSYKERSHDRSTGSLFVIILKFQLWFHEFIEIFRKTFDFPFSDFFWVAFFYQSAFNFSIDFLLNLSEFEWWLPGITGRHNRNNFFEITALVSQIFWDFFTEICFLDLTLVVLFFFFCAALSVTLSLLELLSGCKQK